MEIIQRTDVRTPLALMEAHITASGDDPWTDCPWVKVGNLYMSVTQTANTSWQTLARSLASGTQITVFSGRHGTQAGQAVSESKGHFNAKYVLEGDFFKADVGAAAKFGGAVAVVDAKDIKTTRELQTQTQTALTTRVVIYAWCHSLFSMMDHSEDLYSDLYVLKRGQHKGMNVAVVSRALWLSGKSVKSLVDEWYDWV